MRKTLNLIAGNILFLALSGCGEELMNYDINTDMPVVESYLQEGTNSLTVKVYSMEVYLKEGYDLSKPISGLKPTVNGREMTESSSGTYSLEPGDSIHEKQQYDLHFDYGGKTISASTTVPSPIINLSANPASLTVSSSYYWNTSDTTEVTISWDDPDKSYYQVYIESPNTSDMPALGIFGRRMMQPFTGNTYRATARDFRSTGVHWVYIYRVNKDYAELYERISSSDLANPVSSLQNAFGIFTSLSVARVAVRAYESGE